MAAAKSKTVAAPPVDSKKIDAALARFRSRAFAKIERMDWKIHGAVHLLAAEAMTTDDTESLEAWLSTGLFDSRSKSGRWLMLMYAAELRARNCFDLLIKHAIVPKGHSHDIAETVYSKLRLAALKVAVSAGLNPYAKRYESGLLSQVVAQPLSEQERVLQWLFERITSSKPAKKLDAMLHDHETAVMYEYFPKDAAHFTPLALWDPVAKRYDIALHIYPLRGGYSENIRATIVKEAFARGDFGSPKAVVASLLKDLEGDARIARAIKDSPERQADFTRLLLDLERMGEPKKRQAVRVAAGM